MDIKIGVYRHYKGQFYRVTAIGIHTETGEHLVCYQSLLDDRWWIRPLIMFSEAIIIDGDLQPRFTFVK